MRTINADYGTVLITCFIALPRIWDRARSPLQHYWFTCHTITARLTQIRLHC